MIISQKHRFIFSHNPKVAGSTVRQLLAPLHDHRIEFWHQAWYKEFGRVMDMAHVPMHDLQTVLNLNEYKILVMVRDPYTRFVSSIAEHCRQHDVVLEDAAAMNAWVHKNMDETNFRFNWKYIHFCPQHYFAGCAGEIKVVRFDLPMGAWHEVRRWFTDRLGVNLGIDLGELPIVRSSANYANRFTVDQLDDRSIALINRVYHKDFERFEYPKRYTPVDVSPELSHYDRINSIHNPNLELVPTHLLNAGELKAYHKKYI